MTRLHLATQFFFDSMVLRRPRTIIALMLLLLGFLAFGARNFRLDASSETLVIENDQDLRYSRLINSRYGQDDILVLTYTPRGDLFSEKTLTSLHTLRDELASLSNVSSVVSILDVPLLESPRVSLKQLTGEPITLGAPAAEKDKAKKELVDSPLYRELLISVNGKTTALLINFPPDKVYDQSLSRRNSLREKKTAAGLSGSEQAELEKIEQQLWQYRDRARKQRHDDIIAIRRIMDAHRADAEMFLGGVSMIVDDMISFIKSDLKIFGTGVAVLLIVMLWLIFGGVRWIILPFLCCAVSTIYMIGLLGWLGWEVTVVSSNFVSLQLIITMSLTIHLIVRYREILAQNPDENNRLLILNTIMLKLKPSVYAVLTTIVGFGSLVVCDILPVINFGWMMIIGLVVSLVVTFLLFPTVLILLPKEKIPDRPRWQFSLTTIFANFTEKRNVLILGLSGLLLLLSFVGILKLKVENSFINYFRKNTEIYQGMKFIDQNLGGTTPLDVLVEFESKEDSQAAAKTQPAETDDVFAQFEQYEQDLNDPKYWFTAAKISRIEAVQTYLENLPQTGKVLSLASVLKVVEKLNNGKKLDSFDLALLYSETPDEFKDLLIEPYVSVEHNQVRFWMRVRDSQETLRRNELLRKIKNDLTAVLGLDQGHIKLAGMLVLYNNMLQSLFSSQVLTFGITVLLLMGMFLILFRSLKIAVLAIIPNVLPIAAVLAVMGWLGISLDMMTITIAAIGIGIAVDDTIHYIHRFKSEFPKDRNYLAAMHRCHESIGHAMYYTSITVIIGFSILGLSNFIPTVYFGLLTGLAMVIALVAALTLLPALLVQFKAFGKEENSNGV